MYQYLSINKNRADLHPVFKPFTTEPLQSAMGNLIVRVEASQVGLKHWLLLRGVKVLGLEAPGPPFLNACLHLHHMLAKDYTLKRGTHAGKDECCGRKGYWMKLLPVLNTERVFAPKERGADRAYELFAFEWIGFGLQVLKNSLIIAQNK
jgi:hypothetical protein